MAAVVAAAMLTALVCGVALGALDLLWYWAITLFLWANPMGAFGLPLFIIVFLSPFVFGWLLGWAYLEARKIEI